MDLLNTAEYQRLASLRAMYQKEVERAADAGEAALSPQFQDSLQAEMYEAIGNWAEKVKEEQEKAIRKEPEEVVEQAHIQVTQGKVGLTDHEKAKMQPEVAKEELQHLIATPTQDPHIKRIQELNDSLYFLSCVLPQAAKDPNSRVQWGGVQNLKTYRNFIGALAASEFTKAMATTLTGYGSEWAAEEWSAELIELLFIHGNVINMHQRVTIPRGRKTLNIRRLSSRGTVFYVPEAESDEAPEYPTSQFGTASIPLTAKKFGMNVYLSDEMLEDTILTDFAVARQEMGIELAGSLEDAIINGSTSMADLDNAGGAGNELYTDTTDYRHALNGYRKWAASSGVTSVDLSTFNFTNILNVRGNMGGRPSVDTRDGFWLMNPSGLTNILGLSEVKTIDVFGPQATVVTGSIGNLAGSPIVLTDKIRTNLAATGLYTGTGQTKTVLLYVYRPGFVVGDKREAEFLVDRIMPTGQYQVVVHQRVGFVGRYAAATHVVGVGRNF